jgi:hypothetical protein
MAKRRVKEKTIQNIAGQCIKMMRVQAARV